jgi:hypothetical protein
MARVFNFFSGFNPNIRNAADILPARILVFPGRLTGTVGIRK